MATETKRIALTQLQHANVEYALNEMLPKILEEQMELSSWLTFSGDEGTNNLCIACFGHFVGLDHRFRMQGVFLNRDGAPYSLRTKPEYGTMEVSRLIFGVDWMFKYRLSHYAAKDSYIDAGDVSDHVLIKNRLQWILDNSFVKEPA